MIEQKHENNQQHEELLAARVQHNELLKIHEQTLAELNNANQTIESLKIKLSDTSQQIQELSKSKETALQDITELKAELQVMQDQYLEQSNTISSMTKNHEKEIIDLTASLTPKIKFEKETIEESTNTFTYSHLEAKHEEQNIEKIAEVVESVEVVSTENLTTEEELAALGLANN